MLGECPRCGAPSERRTIHAADDVLVCEECGDASAFLRLPLFFVTGPSGSGKSALAWALARRLSDECLVVDQDILWGIDDRGDREATADAFRRLWLHLATHLSQSGRPVVLCGSARPEDYGSLPDAGFFDIILYAGLVCDDEVLRSRLKARPEWRRCNDGFIEDMVAFNRWFRDHFLTTTALGTLFDTTDRSIDETADEVASWIREKIRSARSHHQYVAWLKEFHATFVTSDDLIDRMVRKAVGGGVASKSRVLLGEVNEVYRIVAAGGDEVVVRIAHREGGRFESERWAIERCREIGVPAPEVLHVESVGEGKEARQFSVQRRIPGTPLDHLLTDPGTAEIHDLVRDAGEILARIHRVPATGYGRFGRDGVGTEPSPGEQLARLGEDIESTRQAAARIQIDPQVVDEAVETLRRHAGRLLAPVVLVHGDYGGKHLLVDGGRITGVLDFENSAYYDPAFDFGWWHFFYERSVPTAVLLEGYRRGAEVPEDFETRILLRALGLAVGMIGYYARREGFSGGWIEERMRDYIHRLE